MPNDVTGGRAPKPPRRRPRPALPLQGEPPAVPLVIDRNPSPAVDEAQRGAMQDRNVRNFLAPEEFTQYGQQAVETRNAEEAANQDTIDLLNRINTSPSLPGDTSAGWTAAGDKPKPSLPVSSPDPVYKRAYMTENYPTVMRVALQTGLTEAELDKVVNYTLAVDAAQKIAATPNPTRAKQLMQTMSLPMQALVFDIFTQMVESLDNPDSPEGNAVGDFVSAALDKTVGNVFSWLGAANEGAQHVARTLYNSVGQGVPLGQSWEETQSGQWDDQQLAELSRQYGATPVRFITRARELAAAGDTDLVGTLTEEFGTSPEMAVLLDAALNGVAPRIDAGNPVFGLRSSEDVQDLIEGVANADMGNLGAVAVYNTLGKVGLDNTPVGNFFRDSTNVIAPFIIDPTIIGSKAYSAYKAARWSVALMSPGKLDKAFANPSVRRFWDTVGSQLQRADGMDAADAGQLMRSLESQYKHYLPGDVLTELRKARVFNADDARRYFGDHENVAALFRGQAARRGPQLRTPHMSRATAVMKLVSLKARGFNPANAGMRRELESIVGSVEGRTPEQIDRIIDAYIQNPERVGALGGDFAYNGNTAQRTIPGRVLGAPERAYRTLPGQQLDEYASVGSRVEKAAPGTQTRYGWRKKGGIPRKLDRLTRNLAIKPDSRGGIYISDGRDSKKIFQLARYAGLSRYHANFLAEVFRRSNPAQRRNIVNGLGRTYGYAVGVHLTDPVRGRALIDEIATATRSDEMYAADHVDPTVVGKRVDDMIDAHKEGQLSEAHAAFLRDIGVPADAEDLALFRPQIMAALGDDVRVSNPAQWGNRQHALFLGQTEERVAFPSIDALDQLTARTSYLSAMLATGPKMSNIVDAWTLAVLFGPRFQLRNGIEDIGLYALTDGSFGRYWAGRQLSTAAREVRGQKLGTVKKVTRWMGDHAPDTMKKFIHPHLTDEERALAVELSAKGDRSGLVELLNKAYLRQRFAYFTDPDVARLAKPGARSSLPARTRQILDDTDDLARTPEGYGLMDEVAEDSRHLVDGVMPTTANPQYDELVLQGVPFRRVTLSRDYTTQKVSAGNPQSVKSWYTNLRFALEADGPKGQVAMTLVPKYLNLDTREEAVRRLAAIIERTDEQWGYSRKMAAFHEAGASYDDMARRTLEAVSQMVTDKDGKLLTKLYKQLSRRDDEGNVSFRLWDGDGAERVERVTVDDLMKFARGGQKPRAVLGMEEVTVHVPDRVPFGDRAWQMMGNSLARMTREPIFMSNYLDAREALRPLERGWAAAVGEKTARKLAAETANQRAYDVTMAFTDNPGVRSKMAWNLRNVARFYRAQEDFNRRMYRTLKNDPVSAWKLALGYRALDSTGFVWTDNYGDKYFVFPGTRPVFEGVNAALNALGVGDLMVPSMPLAFGGKVNMLSPSADPNALFPTFSGPVAAVGISTLMALFPSAKILEEELLGNYAADRTVWERAMPTNVMRAVALLDQLRQGSAAEKAEQRNNLYADSARTVLQMMVANGQIPLDRELTNDERNRILDRVDKQAMAVIGLKTIFGLVFPAQPQLLTQDVTDFAREIGVPTLRSAYLQILNKHDGDVSAATREWFAINPDLMPFMASEYEQSDNAGYYAPVRPLLTWLKDNKDVMDKYPLGAAYFAPTEGEYSQRAWSVLKRSGVKVPYSMSGYMDELIEVGGRNAYRALRNEYLQKYKNAQTQEQKDQLDAQWVAAKDYLDRTFPSSVGGDRTIDGTDALDREIAEVRGATKMMRARGDNSDRVVWFTDILRLWDEAITTFNSVSENDPNYKETRSGVRDAWRNLIRVVQERTDDEQVNAFLVYVTARRLGINDV